MRQLDAIYLRRHDMPGYEAWHRRLVNCWYDTREGRDPTDPDAVSRWHQLVRDRYGIEIVLPDGGKTRGTWILNIHDEDKAVEFALRWT